MELSEHKLSLIERLIRVRNQETLTQDEVTPLNEFSESNQSWLKNKSSK